MPEAAGAEAAATDHHLCDACGTEIAPRLLSCPACSRLVHGDALRRLAQRAEAARESGDLTASLAAWRQALDLLPARSRQASSIAAKVEELSLQVDDSSEEKESGGKPAVTSWARGGILATVGLLAWKLKAVLAFVITKGKVLLLGLTKSSTLFSMLLSAGLYWTLWGWKFAFGLVLSIYVHEMGHVMALRRLGIPSTAPMFIPGLGALIRLKQYPANPREDARVGLAGPIWGLGAVVVAYLAHLATGWASLAAIARFGAWINLFNLLPVWQLDGGRGFRALGKRERWILVAVIGGMWFLTSEGLLALLLLVGGLGALFGRPPEVNDRTTFWQFIGLVVVLSWFSTLAVPGIAALP